MSEQQANDADDVEAGHRPPSAGRRALLTGGAALVTGGVLGAGASAATADGGYKGEPLVIECAALGPSFRDFPIFLMRPELELDEGDVTGSPFFAQGLLYPEGTIKGDGFVPSEEGSIGSFFCRGHLLISPQWPAPHLMSHHEYYLGDPTRFPLDADMLTSIGPEGANEYPWTAKRAITGGTGTYRGVRGEMTQTQFATNTTLDGFGTPAPCFRFEFDIDLPS